MISKGKDQNSDSNNSENDRRIHQKCKPAPWVRFSKVVEINHSDAWTLGKRSEKKAQVDKIALRKCDVRSQFFFFFSQSCWVILEN